MISISITVFIGCVHAALKSILNSIYYHNMPYPVSTAVSRIACVFQPVWLNLSESAPTSLVDLY